MNLAQVTKLTEDGARDYLESIRWPEGAVCPHCNSKTVTKLQGKSTRPGVYKCKNKECRKQFTVTVNTIFERSHVAIRLWVIAFHLMCSSKKGFSAHQLHRNLGVTYKTAWFMFHRIRHALANGPFPEKLKGTIEADETYVGGKPKPGTGKRGHGTKKAPVMVLIQRDGSARAVVVERVTAQEIRNHIEKNVEVPESRLMTDELRLYTKIGREFQSHGVVKHRAKVYVDGEIYSNTAESYFALLKRGHYGVYHQISKPHLQKYVDEFSFRWDHRDVSDGARREAALRMVEGKRLKYK